MTSRALLPCLALLVALTAFAAPVAALEIFYEVEEEMGPPGEGGFWFYTFTLSEQSFGAGEGFAVLFDPGEFDSLFARSASDDWDVIAIQPDPLLPDFGALDALALVNDPDTTVSFEVPVLFTGDGTPPALPWIRYGVDFGVLESGTTLPVGVPEPGVSLLFLSAGAFAALRRLA